MLFNRQRWENLVVHSPRKCSGRSDRPVVNTVVIDRGLKRRDPGALCGIQARQISSCPIWGRRKLDCPCTRLGRMPENWLCAVTVSRLNSGRWYVICPRPHLGHQGARYPHADHAAVQRCLSGLAFNEGTVMLAPEQQQPERLRFTDCSYVYPCTSQ
ncbi:hypothetical protein VTI28DRAFT_4492 [Corynascus sepedonium]